MSADDDRGPNGRYQMFSREGNDACEALVVRVVEMIEAGKVNRSSLITVIHLEMREVEKTHDEVWDTEPRGQILWEVSKRGCEPQMWLPIDY